MNAYFSAGRLSNEEKEDILKQHRTLYDGYRTLQPKVSNEQPLYVQDFAKDKVGAVLNNKGVAKPYTNVGINEQVESKEVCDECGSLMMEGECTECGWKGEVGEQILPIDHEKIDDEEIEIEPSLTPQEKAKEMKDIPREFRPGVDFGAAFSKFKKKMAGLDEEIGRLEDIYKVHDLGDDEFDYVEGGGNEENTFEKAHHMKKIKSEQYEGTSDDPDNEDDGFEDIESSELDELGSKELKKGKKYKYSSPSFEDEIEYEDEIEDKSGGKKMYKFKGKDFSYLMPDKSVERDVTDLDEQGYTGGGNAPDMDISNIKPAYDFISNGPDEVYPTESEMEEEWEQMESAWSEEEMDEANDVSGSQGVYGDMKPAYDFDSEGPGKAGPYQRSSWGGSSEEDEDAYWEKDLEPGELDLDIEKFNPEDKSWEEIKAHTGSWDEIDEDLQESFVNQKNKIMEMMTRMKVIK